MSRYARFLHRTLATDASKMTVLAGVPEKHAARAVRIYRPAKVATQQGRGAMTQMWRVQFEKVPGDDRWTNPLMGWTSTADPLSNMGMAFPSKEAAVEYAQRNGYDYSITLPEKEQKKVRKIEPFRRAMVHHWRHQVPEYDEESK